MHLFVITSVVYSKLPSPVSSIERYEQLHETINSVHKYMKNTDYSIIVLEGIVLPQDQIDRLMPKINHLFSINGILDLPKSLGESVLLMTFFSSQEFKHIQKNVETISKLSGRYYFTDSFDFFKYDMRSSVIKHDIRSWFRPDAGIYDTRYYRFHIDHIHYFTQKLQNVIESIINKQEPDIEHAFFSNQILPPHTLVYPKDLGVEGLISISNQIVKD
jgi:hypothetical protein